WVARSPHPPTARDGLLFPIEGVRRHVSGAFVRLPIIGGLMPRGADHSAPLSMRCRGPSCELRYERVVGLCFGLRCLPGGAEEREQEAVEPEIPGGLPGEDEHDGQDEQDG